MRSNDLVTQTIHAAIDGVNATPGIPTRVGKSPDTVLVGENGALDSMGFVAFITAVEESLQRLLDKSIAVMDLFVDDIESSCTVAEFERRVTRMIDAV